MKHAFPTAEYHPLEFTDEDENRTSALDRTSALVLLGIARVLAEAPEEELPELLETLRFNAIETLAAIDEDRGDPGEIWNEGSDALVDERDPVPAASCARHYSRAYDCLACDDANGLEHI